MADLRFDSILVATDLSPSSRAAYGHAVAFARAYGAKVTVLYVDEDTDEKVLAEVPEIAVQRASEEKRHVEELERVEASFKELGLAVRVQRAAGTADRAILEHAESASSDIIILAKHGVRENDPGLMGTTTERVMHHASVPVLIGYSTDPRLGEVAEYKRFTVSTDYSDDSRYGIKRVLDLAESFDAQVDVIHAITLPGEVKAGWRDTYVEAQLKHLNTTLAEEIQNPRAHGAIFAGMRVPETVLNGAQRTGSDLLCVPTHGKGAIRRALFGSIADRVMKLAPMPAMIMPRSWLRGG